ncbi:hypothetical protein Trydic_g1916 [Trypoxylus dichotomus]
MRSSAIALVLLVLVVCNNVHGSSESKSNYWIGKRGCSLKETYVCTVCLRSIICCWPYVGNITQLEESQVGNLSRTSSKVSTTSNAPPGRRRK